MAGDFGGNPGFGGSALPGGTERILVVDDEFMVREVAKDLLEELGYTVVAVTDGGSALDILRETREPFDLVVLDMVMPGMNGLETLTAIRDSWPEQKVFLVSGYDSDDKIQQALQMDNVEFLQKPYKISDMAMMVRQFLDRG